MINMWQELISKLKKCIRRDSEHCNNSQSNVINSHSNGIQINNQSYIKFSKKFEKYLLNNQDKLLIDEISRQYHLFFYIHQKYDDFLDCDEKKLFSKIINLKTISIKDEKKPSLIAIINQNNQIDAFFKKLDHEKHDSQKKAYLKSFLSEKIGYFIIDEILESYTSKDESKDVLTYTSRVLSKL